ncbi:hypothetical protein QNO07_18820 [Streptomyces sp. 549]|uniref:hypothetical protein n=1 Tax=Streptomyces sp. 549 TaxID=3049076 RepID=UPI0024C42DF0|nr:hypothetical protein [Streptomyces sp. 549]MDK1475446.1 hypothetical protein [Streptomyces sp. 549]
MPPTPAPPESKAADGSPRRTDACPGALRLHTADDGALARIRVPGGLLTSAQALCVAELAERLGDGELHLTSRGNVQLRGLTADCGGTLGAALHDAGLLPSERHERARNIVAGPLAGLDHTPGAAASRASDGPERPGSPDLSAWVRQLDALLCADERAAALSGRFLFALDDGRGDVASLGADVTLLAEPPARPHAQPGAGPVEQPEPGTDSLSAASGGTAVLVLGPGPEGLRLPAADGPRAALVAAETFLTAAETHLRSGGARAWRTGDLPPDLLPDTGALASALAAAGITARPVHRPLPADGPAPEPGTVPGPDGRVALSVLLPLGRATAAMWRRLAETAERDGTGELRLTPWRGVVLPGLPPGTADDRLRELADAGLVTSPASPWHGVGACTGRPGCAKSLADVRADAAHAATHAAAHATAHATAHAAALTGPAGPAAAGGTGDRPGGLLPVYWSGCARRCGHPAGAHVEVTATEDGYLVSALPARTPATPPGTTDLTASDLTASGPSTPGPTTPGPDRPRPVPAHRLPTAVAAARATTPPGPSDPSDLAGPPGPSAPDAPAGPPR